jgi:hypothetical protein
MKDEARQAIGVIDVAIAEIRRAAIADGKSIHDHVAVDVRLSRTHRFHKAIELISQAKQDVAGEEDQPATRGLQKRVLGDIEDAQHEAEHVIATVLTRG